LNSGSEFGPLCRFSLPLPLATTRRTTNDDKDARDGGRTLCTHIHKLQEEVGTNMT
jgi:hypothetical protein